ncbi:hypothetical protein STEG23_016436 [Scotinomys teguina]
MSLPNGPEDAAIRLQGPGFGQPCHQRHDTSFPLRKGKANEGNDEAKGWLSPIHCRLKMQQSGERRPTAVVLMGMSTKFRVSETGSPVPLKVVGL